MTAPTQPYRDPRRVAPPLPKRAGDFEMVGNGKWHIVTASEATQRESAR